MDSQYSQSTWANINVLWRESAPYQSPDEFRRLERVAVGRICGCGTCHCCLELQKEKQCTRITMR